MSTKSRGRPKKAPEDQRSKNDLVKVEPSRKEILRQEATRCGVSMAEMFRRTAFEEIEPQERPMPYPDVLRWLLKIAQEVSEKAETLDAKWLLEDLRDLESELKLKGVEVHQERSKREEYRTAAEEERLEEQVSFTLTKEEYEWLEDMAERKEVPLRRLLREAAFEQIRKREDMAKIEDRLREWEETITEIRKQEEIKGKEPDDEDRVRKAMKEIGLRISRFVKEETNWQLR